MEIIAKEAEDIQASPPDWKDVKSAVNVVATEENYRRTRRIPRTLSTPPSRRRAVGNQPSGRAEEVPGTRGGYSLRGVKIR